MSINWRQTFIRFVRIYFLADKSISRASADDVTWNLLRIGVWLITPYLAILNKTQFYNHFTLITKHYSRVQKLGLVHRNEMPFKIHDNWHLRDFKFRLARGGGSKLMLHPIFFFCWLNRMANFVNVLSAYRWKWPFFIYWYQKYTNAMHTGFLTKLFGNAGKNWGLWKMVSAFSLINMD